MTVEERLQQTIGAQAFQIAILQTELEKAQAQLAEAQKEKPAGDQGGQDQPGPPKSRL